MHETANPFAMGMTATEKCEVCKEPFTYMGPENHILTRGFFKVGEDEKICDDCWELIAEEDSRF